MEYSIKILSFRKMFFFFIIFISFIVFSLATDVQVNDLPPLSVSKITVNATLNSDCTSVVLSQEDVLPANGNGQVFTRFDPNDMTELPNYICKYRNGGLVSVENVQGYDFTGELVYRNQDLSVWSNKTDVIVNGTPVYVPFDKERRQDFFFNHTNGGDNSVVNIRKGGNYFVSFDVSLDVNVGNASTSSNCWLTNSGIKIEGTDVYGSHRNEVAGADTLSMSQIVQLSKGSMVRVQCRSLGANTLVLIPGGSHLTIQYARKNM